MKNSIYSSLIAVLLLCFCSNNANAQEKKDTVSNLQEVEIFGDRAKKQRGLEMITRFPGNPQDQVQSISTISEKLIEEQGQKVPDVASQYNVGKSTLEKWLQRYRAEQSGKPLATGRAITPEQQEIQRLKKENAQLRLERDILNEEG